MARDFDPGYAPLPVDARQPNLCAYILLLNFYHCAYAIYSCKFTPLLQFPLESLPLCLHFSPKFLLVLTILSFFLNIELVLFLPSLCRKMGIPYCIIKGKARLVWR
uniref:60S ribosomal protein L7a n=1 Tax=Cacopsylla melanoneura TaxID=428564 RepID=A0A8D8UVN5_9HEMI